MYSLFQLQKESLALLNLIRSKLPNLGYKKKSEKNRYFHRAWNTVSFLEKRRVSRPHSVCFTLCEDTSRKKQSSKERNTISWPIRWKLPRIPSANTSRMFPSLHLVFILLLPVKQVGLAYAEPVCIWQKSSGGGCEIRGHARH